MQAFAEWTRPSKEETALRRNVFTCFEKVVAALWPSARCELFGSSMTGIHLPDGDFDVVVQDENLLYLPTYNVLESLQDALIVAGFAHPRDIRLITGAKVPIIKLKTTEHFGGFKIDVSFNSPKGPLGARESLRLLREVDGRYPGSAERVRRLTLLVKALLVTRGLNEVRDGGIGGLTVFCMVSSYVQLYPRLPFDPKIAAANDLLAFLFLYGTSFDYAQKTISTANGGGLLHKPTRFPNSRSDRLSIVHPVEPNRDLASGSYEYQSIIAVFEHSRNRLMAWPSPSERQSGHRPSALAAAGFLISKAALSQRRINAALILDRTLEFLADAWTPTLYSSEDEYADPGADAEGLLDSFTPEEQRLLFALSGDERWSELLREHPAPNRSDPAPSARPVLPRPPVSTHPTRSMLSAGSPPFAPRGASTTSYFSANSTAQVESAFARMSLNAPPSLSTNGALSEAPFTSSTASSSYSSYALVYGQTSQLPRPSPVASNASTPLSTPSEHEADLVVYKPADLTRSDSGRVQTVSARSSVDSNSSTPRYEAFGDLPPVASSTPSPVTSSTPSPEKSSRRRNASGGEGRPNGDDRPPRSPRSKRGAAGGVSRSERSDLTKSPASRKGRPNGSPGSSPDGGTRPHWRP